MRRTRSTSPLITPSWSSRRSRGVGFSLIELLVVIAIIGILVSILIPVISKVRRKAQDADTQALISKLQGAIEQYKNDYAAYPGPLSDDDLGRRAGNSATTSQIIYTNATPPYFGGVTNQIRQDMPVGYFGAPGQPPAYNTFGTFTTSITGTNNLVLGLYGGLAYLPGNGPGTNTTGNNIYYQPQDVGKGPASLNPGSPRTPSPYMDAKDLSWNTQNSLITGRYCPEGVQYDPTNAGSVAAVSELLAKDCIIPSIVDRYSDKLPLLYLRSRVGAPAVAGWHGKYPDGTGAGGPIAQYDLAHIIGYTGSKIGFSSKLKEADRYPIADQAPANYTAGYPHGLRRIFSAELANTGKIPTFDKNAAAGNPTPVYVYPYDLELYLTSVGVSNATQSGTSSHYYQTVPKAKDSYILISAGPDRIYGTNDDITTMGQVTP